MFVFVYKRTKSKKDFFFVLLDIDIHKKNTHNKRLRRSTSLAFFFTAHWIPPWILYIKIRIIIPLENKNGNEFKYEENENEIKIFQCWCQHYSSETNKSRLQSSLIWILSECLVSLGIADFRNIINVLRIKGINMYIYKYMGVEESFILFVIKRKQVRVMVYER